VSDLSEAISAGGAKRGPAGAILRAAELKPWLDGQGFLEAAKRELEQARRNAEESAAAERARGYAEGWAAGSKGAFDLVARTKAAADAYYGQLEANLAHLVMEIISEVIDGLGQTEAIALAIQKALSRVETPPDTAILVSPGALVGVMETLKAKLGTSGEGPAITIGADDGLGPDECRLVSTYSTIDLSLKRQLDLLAESLCSAKIGLKP
jgi:flagellar biosynthesis/type III secretory pathway protein FliH